MNLSFKKSFVKQVNLLPKDIKSNVLEIIDILHKADRLEDTFLDYKNWVDKRKTNAITTVLEQAHIV